MARIAVDYTPEVFPIRDSTPSQTFPIVNYVLIGERNWVFFLQLGEDSFVERFGMISARVLHPDQPIETVRSVAILTRVRSPPEVPQAQVLHSLPIPLLGVVPRFTRPRAFR